MSFSSLILYVIETFFRRRPSNTWVIPPVTILIFLTVSSWTFADLHLIVREQLALQLNPFVILHTIKMFKDINTMEVVMVRVNVSRVVSNHPLVQLPNHLSVYPL